MRMTGLEKIETIRKYADYCEQHIRNVGKAWDILKAALSQHKVVWNDFDFHTTRSMIEDHDASKMCADEFTAYAEWFFGPHGKNGKEDKDCVLTKTAFDTAWEHHKRHNPHHWQNWTKAAERFPGEAVCHLVCMVADWMAMGMAFGDTAEQYYEREKGNMELPGWAVEYLADIFAELCKAEAK